MKIEGRNRLLGNGEGLLQVMRRYEGMRWGRGRASRRGGMRSPGLLVEGGGGGDRGVGARRSGDYVWVRGSIFDPYAALSWSTATIFIAASFDGGPPLDEIAENGVAAR